MIRVGPVPRHLHPHHPIRSKNGRTGLLRDNSPLEPGQHHTKVAPSRNARHQSSPGHTGSVVCQGIDVDPRHDRAEPRRPRAPPGQDRFYYCCGLSAYPRQALQTGRAPTRAWMPFSGYALGCTWWERFMARLDCSASWCWPETR